MAKECATPLNYSKGEFQCSFSPKSRTAKEQGAQQTQLKQPHFPQISKMLS